MEPFLADLINNPKIPKAIRYILVLGVSSFLLCLGIFCAVESPMIIGKVFGIILCVLIFAAVFYLLRKIHRSEENESQKRSKRARNWNLGASVFQLFVGILAVVAFILIGLQGESVVKWIGTLVLAIAFVVLGIAGIRKYTAQEGNTKKQ